MSFYKKYELERLIADGEAKTFRATESATGRNVLLHLFSPGGQPLLAELKAKLLGAGGKPVPPLVEIGEFAGSQYAVTEASEPFPGLREWVKRLPAAVTPSPVVAPRPPADAAPAAPPPSKLGPAGTPSGSGLLDDEPGEFTRLFPPSPVEKPAVPSRPPAAAPPPGLLDDGPGEFTRLFPPSPVEKPAVPSRPPAAAPPPRLLDDEPGEFTRLFPPSPVEKPAPPSRPLAAAPPPGLLDDASGEFHQVISPSRPSRSTPAVPPAQDPGDFTRAFGGAPPKAPDRPRPPVRLPPPSPPPLGRDVPPPGAPAGMAGSADTGEFAKLFGSGLSGEAIDIAGEQAKAAQAAANLNRPFQKAGEFTRMFGPEMGGPAAAGPPPAAPLSLNTAASGVFGSHLQPGPANDASEMPRQAGANSDPGEYTRVFGEKPVPPEAPKPPEAGKPAAVIPLAAPKPRMQPAVIIGIVAAVAVLIVLIVYAVMLSQRAH